eukprot:Sspe_Gene.108660::Locus_87783_Transcript_1_1_Confidence_1.000_Length_630::g.108660::m.108660
MIPRKIMKAVRDQEYFRYEFTVLGMEGVPHDSGREYFINWQRGSHEGSSRTAQSQPNGKVTFGDKFKFVTGLYMKENGYMTKKMKIKIYQRSVKFGAAGLKACNKRRDKEELNARKVGEATFDIAIHTQPTTAHFNLPVECEGPSVQLKFSVKATPCSVASHEQGAKVEAPDQK